MSSRRRSIAAVITALVIGSGLSWAGVPVGTAFTYQAQLKDNGVPAEGPHNLVFRLFDNFNAQVGGDIAFNAYPVVNGLFSVELDFGAGVFNGDRRELEIQVNGTPLIPRQPLNAAPYALYALGGPGGGTGEHWTASGSAITNTNDGFVGVNRSTALAGTEYFGIDAPATGTNFGGMYIRTESATAKPFYGYRAGSSGLVRTASTQLDGANGNWQVNNGGVRMTVTSTGYVGIGTAVPENARLDVALVGGAGGNGWAAGKFVHEDLVEYGYGVYGSTNSPNGTAVFGQSRSATAYGGRFLGGACTTGFLACGPALQVGGDSHFIGPVGILTTTPAANLHVIGSSDVNPRDGGFAIFGGLDGANIGVDNNEIMARDNGVASTLFLNNEGGDVRIGQNGGSTRVFMPVLVVTGADVAEKFPLSDASIVAEPGAVMEIDPTSSGKLRVAHGAYNRMVAGVVSGAGGLSAGTILGNLPGLEDAPAIALSGRVWVRSDTLGGPISPGDLLTTSDTAGHAMKVTDFAKAQGAIIGKAMTPLTSGTGLVLVLVTLQ